MTVSLEDARRVIAAGEARATEIGQQMNIAVVDSGGNRVAHVRLDGAWIGSVNISINKAWTSKAFDISTKDLGDDSQPGQQFYGSFEVRQRPRQCDHGIERRDLAGPPRPTP